jgi:hypothetical protein
MQQESARTRQNAEGVKGAASFAMDVAQKHVLWLGPEGAHRFCDNDIHKNNLKRVA